LASCEQAVAEREEQINNLAQLLADRDEQITRLNQAIAERDEQITKLNRAIADRDNRIEELNQAVAERAGQINNLVQLLADRDEHVSRLTNVVEAIYKSRSWRITSPLRFITTKIRRFLQPKPRWGIGSQLIAALLTLPATFYFYKNFIELLHELRKGKTFFSQVLDDPSGTFNRLRHSRRLARLAIMIPLLMAWLIRNNGGVMPTFYEVYKAVRRDGMRGARFWFMQLYSVLMRGVRAINNEGRKLNAYSDNFLNVNVGESEWKLRNYNKRRPVVSVIVPNYNHAAYLYDRLESIYGQTYKNIEVILLDDCSSDDSRRILEEYANKYSDKTRLILNEQNSGSPFAQWLKGIELASGDLIWIAESDDYCEDNFLETLVDYFNDEAVMLAYCRTVFVKNGKRVWTTEEYLADIDLAKWSRSFVCTAHQLVNSSFALKNIIPNVSSAVFRNPFDLQLFSDPVWKKMKVCGDWLFYLHIIRGGVVAYSCETTNYYRQHDKNISVALQKEDIYYQEHQIVAEHVATLYKVSDNVFEQQEVMLKTFWRSNRNDYSDEQFRKCYDIRKIKSKMANRKPNVLMFGFAFSSGGGEMVPIVLANGLKKNGYGITFVDCNLQQRNDGVRRMLDPSIPVVVLNSMMDLPDIVNQLGGEILHSQHASVDVAISNFKAYFQSSRHIVTLHGMYETMNEGELRFLLPKLSVTVDKWLFTAQKNLEPFRRYGYCDENKFGEISNALPPAEIFPIDRSLLNIPESAFILCLVSRAIPEKGWEEAIQTVRLARKLTGKDIRLLLIGDGPEYERLSDLGDEYIQFLGFRSNIRDYFAMSDLGYLPSRFRGESFPLVVIDCLLAGRPVLASDLGEIKQMLTSESGKMAGDVFQLQEWSIPIETVANLIARYATDEVYYGDKLAEVKNVAEKFKLSTVLNKLEYYYNGLITEK